MKKIRNLEMKRDRILFVLCLKCMYLVYSYPSTLLDFAVF